MPTMTNCTVDGHVVGIDRAVDLRDQADNKGVTRPDFRCIECNQPVRAHKSGGHAAAHFEHLERNPDCSLSDRR